MKSAQVIWTIIGVIVLIGLTYFITIYFNGNKDTTTSTSPVTQATPVKRVADENGYVVPTAEELYAQLV